MSETDHITLSSLVHQATGRFEREFGRAPQWIVAAPGRVNLIGEHTDYNGGHVLPLAIDRYVVIAADLAVTKKVRACSGILNQTAEFQATSTLVPGEPKWANYLRGVVAGMIQRGLNVPGFDCFIETNIPLGGGLSSSAALEVATATLIETMTGQALESIDKIRICQLAEHDFAGMPCGIMDQFTSTLGEADAALLIDCGSETSRSVPIDSDQVAVLIINSGVRHALVGSPYAERRAHCHRAAEILDVPTLSCVSSHRLEAYRDRLEPHLYHRARHVVSENERTVQMATELAKFNWPAAGVLMYESHASMRDDFEISCEELDYLVNLASGLGKTHGVYGSRMTGGGFGGCTVTLVQAAHGESVARSIAQEYQCHTGIAADWFVTRAAAGTRVISAATVTT